MRKMLLAAGAAVLLSAASPVFAAEASGTITAIDTTAGTITLDNGSVYTLASGVKADGWKVGDKVMVTYDETGGKMTVTAVTPQT